MSYTLSNNCLKASSIAVFLLIFQFSRAQGTFDGIDQIVASKQKLIGTDVVVVVATKDTVVYQKNPKLFTGRTQAPIGHSSQWLTTALILQLVDEGKLSLDDKVSQFLPVFEKYGKSYITLAHCLSHFTGIQADKNVKLFDKKKFASLDEAVSGYAGREIQSNAGTEFRYTLYGPMIAARVAEVVTKKKFDQLIQQRLFRPLGMRQTSFSTLDGSAPNPATGARSTANDLTRFLRMLLNGGTLHGQKILSAESVQALRRISTEPALIKSAPDLTRNFQYALGAWVPEQAGKEAQVLAGPSFGGTLPVVDFCRGYAFLILLKEETEDAKADVYAGVKEVLDGRFGKNCE